MIYPVITLYQPWATWIMRGWKTIETRTHDRFRCLEGKTILIHAGKHTDVGAANNPYLTRQQLLHRPDEVINGHIIGSATVWKFQDLNTFHSIDALIDCLSVQRWGLFLKDITSIDPIKASGSMGIWYYDLERREKVKKPDSPNQSKLF